MTREGRDGQSPHHELRSYGRRRGRKRSARQQNIFEDGLAQWGVPVTGPGLAESAAHLLTPDRPLWLEIGFGGGEHLIWQARHNPDVLIIGAEPFEDGVVKVLTAIEEQDLTNIRVFPGDVRDLLRALPPASLAKGFILFPDPWPKSRHAKRRLVSADLLDQLDSTLVDGAELRIGTDSAAYACDILQRVQHHSRFFWPVNRPGDWRLRPQSWPQTRYEQKALNAGRRSYFFRFVHRPGK